MVASEWAPVCLGNVCTKIGSGATPRGGSDVYLEHGPYALIRSQNVYNDGFHRDGLAFIGEKHAAEPGERRSFLWRRSSQHYRRFRRAGVPS